MEHFAMHKPSKIHPSLLPKISDKLRCGNMDSAVYYYHGDHLGSASWITDSNGTPVQHLQYMPYGEPFVNERTTGYEERFTFTGKTCSPFLHYHFVNHANSCGNAIANSLGLLHAETGFSYFGARYYDSDLMTGWLSVDPMADKYPGLSPYAYCAWNPVKLVDPDGKEIWIVGDDGSTITYTPTMLSKNISGFSQQVIDGLNNIYNSCEEGKDLINQLSSSQHVFTIKKIEKGLSSFTPDSPSESYCLNKKEVVTNLKEWFESGKGIGSSGTILWNTNGYNILTTEGLRNDPVFHLLHELAHAFDSNLGLMWAKKTEESKLSPDEWSACYKSNCIAPFMGFPLQSYYGGECDIYGNYIGNGTKVLDENNKPYICYE